MFLNGNPRGSICCVISCHGESSSSPTSKVLLLVWRFINHRFLLNWPIVTFYQFHRELNDINISFIVFLRLHLTVFSKSEYFSWYLAFNTALSTYPYDMLRHALRKAITPCSFSHQPTIWRQQSRQFFNFTRKSWSNTTKQQCHHFKHHNFTYLPPKMFSTVSAGVVAGSAAVAPTNTFNINGEDVSQRKESPRQALSRSRIENSPSDDTSLENVISHLEANHSGNSNRYAAADDDDDYEDEDEKGYRPKSRKASFPFDQTTPDNTPSLSSLIRQDMHDREKQHILEAATSNVLAASAPAVWDDSDPQGCIEALQTQIVHDMNRVSICLAPVAQNLSMVNNFGQMYNREKDRQIIPIFTIKNLEEFQHRLVNRYRRVMTYNARKINRKDAPEVFTKLQGAQQLCQYDIALMFCIDQAVEMFHPRHPQSFLQTSIQNQADFMLRRRNDIAKQLRKEFPSISQEKFQGLFAQRVAEDFQNLSEQLEVRKFHEEKRWARMQRAQVHRARLQKQREDQLNGFADYDKKPHTPLWVDAGGKITFRPPKQSSLVLSDDSEIV